MSYFRVSTASADVPLNDLGITLVHPVSNRVLSNTFSVEDLQNSADLIAAIVAGTLLAQVNLDSVWTNVTAASFTGDEIYAAYANIWEIVTTTNNEELVKGGDTALHKHDQMYFTETEINATTGASLVGVDSSTWTKITPVTPGTVQQALNRIDAKFGSFSLDDVYQNDSDGVLFVNGSSKPLELRSDNTNEIAMTRTNGTNTQDFLRMKLSANELQLGSLVAGALARANVRILSDIIIDGNITFNGTITDQTVNEYNVTNSKIVMREGAVTDADAFLEVRRPVGGTDSVLKWNNTTSRWQAGLLGAERTIALLEANEVVTGIYEMQGSATTTPNAYFTNKGAAPTTGLGSASQIPLATINNTLAVYDKTNSRNKWLSVAREKMIFTGRDNASNANEYARNGLFTSIQAGTPLEVNSTLLAISVQTNGNATWTAEVRKNGSATVLASLAVSAASSARVLTLNVDFAQGDQIQVFINGTGVNRPIIKLTFAERF